MELNSLEAIKNAVQSGLGAAFLPVVSIEREASEGYKIPPQRQIDIKDFAVAYVNEIDPLTGKKRGALDSKFEGFSFVDESAAQQMIMSGSVRSGAATMMASLSQSQRR